MWKTKLLNLVYVEFKSKVKFLKIKYIYQGCHVYHTGECDFKLR